ncbi:MAG: DUF1207 domain-containing protein [Candidatus Kapaibacterium sp.]
MPSTPMKHPFLQTMVTRVLVLTLIATTSLRAQHLLFAPLLANPFEARIGTMYQASDDRLRLDIGHSFDLMTLDSAAAGQWNLGGDFFTYTRLRSEGRLKFPVETVDYFFGLNTSRRWNLRTSTADLRVRVAHISAHLADGLADTSGTLHPKPFVYSREFVDAVGAVTFGGTRLYAGFTAVFSNRRTSPQTNLIIPQAGIEVKHRLGGSIQAFAALDTKLSGLDGAVSPVHAVQAGIIIPQRGGYDLILSGYYYDGLSMHGLFLSTHDSYLGFGFQIGI